MNLDRMVDKAISKAGQVERVESRKSSSREDVGAETDAETTALDEAGFERLAEER